MAIIKQITLIVTFMKECRICMKTNITINPPASIIQQTLEPQQAFPPLVRDTVGPTYTMSKVGYTSPAPALAGSNFGVAVRRGSLSRLLGDLHIKRKNAQWHPPLETVSMLLKVTAWLYHVKKPFNQTSF